MAGGPHDSSLTRVQPFFGGLIRRDPSGTSWLGALLAAIPHGHAVFGKLLEDPGVLSAPLTGPRADSGVLQCFEFGVAPPRSLLQWFVEHPDRLSWPRNQVYGAETRVLRRSLVDDDPAGSRAAVQQKARDLAATARTDRRAWWRFEGTSMVDCVLMTDRRTAIPQT